MLCFGKFPLVNKFRANKGGVSRVSVENFLSHSAENFCRGVFCDVCPPTSLISDDEDDDMLTPITGNPAQFLPYTPNRHPFPIQLCQQITPIPDTPESPTPENRGQPDIFRPRAIPNEPSPTILNNTPIITTVADGLRNMTLHPHPQRNEWVTGVLVCGKSYDQVIEETVADYLNQTA